MRTLLRAERGAGAIEFAITLPVLLGLGLVGVEVAHYALTNLIVSNIAVATADNAARVRETIDEADVDELFIGAEQTGKRISFKQQGRVILTDLEASGTKQWIRWQRCFGEKTVHAPRFGRPMTRLGANIVDGTEIYRSDRSTTSANPSKPDASTMTAFGPAGNQIAAQGGTAVMVAEVVYEYRSIVPNNYLDGRIIRHVGAFNVRQRSDHKLWNSAKVTPKSCG